MEKEIRQYNVEFKSAPENSLIEGRAIPFNIASPNREGFRETIAPEAVEGVFEKSDVFLLYNHDRSKGFLARNKMGRGSLSIDVREDGVYFSFTPGNDNLSMYIKDRIQRGDLDEMSFAFTVEKDTWEKAADGVYDRTINRFDHLYDFSIVDQSYYGIENAVKCTRYAEVLEEERLANEEKIAELAAEEARLEEEARQKAEQEEKERREAEEAEKLEKLKEYYDSIRETYKEALEKADEMNNNQ